ncbi:MAG: outer membrane protein assembly factor BamB family protein [Anaerolineae bacterium]
MSNRSSLTIVLAVVLMVLVMGVAAVVTFSGSASRDKWTFPESWSAQAASVQSMKVTSLLGKSKTDLFVQTLDTVMVYDASGQLALGEQLGAPLATTLADMDGDARQDIIAFYIGSEGPTVAALRATGGKVIWQRALPDIGTPARAAAVDFEGNGRAWIVVGDQTGHLVALDPAGQVVWHYTLADTSELRGLDTILAPGKTQLIAVASRGGDVAVLNRQGQVAWTYTLPGGLRRLRTYDIQTPGRSTVLLGGEGGEVIALEGGSGQRLWTAGVGQAVTEIRLAELDGDPAAHEIVVGGKKGGVWAFDRSGQRVFSTSAGGAKVMEIAALPQSGSDRDLVAVGDENGSVTFLRANGSKLGSVSYSAPINRLAVGAVGGREQLLVADASQVRAVAPEIRVAPFWYTPLLGGLLACAVIAVAAWLVGSAKPAPALQLSAEQMTVEAQKARRLMLHESIADLERLRQAGEVPADAYLARLKDLRTQLADAEANLIKLGVAIQPETMRCPHCGGALTLGTDRCEYCGQTVIT